jgi:hypothetical protein
MTTSPFVILGTPRSRTAWLAKFLAFEGRRVLHEPSTDFRSIDDLYDLLEDPSVAGIVDSMLTFRWRDVLVAAPDARIVVVHRPLHDIVDSFMRTGIFKHDVARNQSRLNIMLRKHEKAMVDLMYSATVLAVPFADLASREFADRVFRYCLRERLPEGWWERWRNVNVQADVHESASRAAANRDGLMAVYPEIEEADWEEMGSWLSR